VEREALLEFQNETIKLTLKNGFVIDGKITHVYNGCFRFETRDGVSLISFDSVMEILRRGQR